MTTKLHPTDAMKMPRYSELVRHLGAVQANLLIRTKWKDGIDIEVLNHGMEETIRAERIKAYDLALEDAAKKYPSIARQLRSMKHEQH